MVVDRKEDGSQHSGGVGVQLQTTQTSSSSSSAWPLEVFALEAALLQKEAAEAQKVPIHHKSNLLLLAQMCVGTPPRCQATHGQMR